MATEKGGVNLREQILSQAGKMATETITVPEWGDVVVEVRELSGKQAREFEEAVMKAQPSALGMLLQQCLCDPTTHALLFEPTDRGTIEELGMKALKPLIQCAQELSGIAQTDIDKAKAFLARTQGNGSTS